MNDKRYPSNIARICICIFVHVGSEMHCKFENCFYFSCIVLRLNKKYCGMSAGTVVSK